MIWKHLLQAAVVCIVFISTPGYAVLPLWTSYLLSMQSQEPLEGPGCDGSGVVDPDGRCNGDGVVDSPPDPRREGFRFENPSTDCKYVSQMYIYDVFKVLEKDMGKLFTYVHKDVDFHVMGHHPVAGHYHDLLHFYVNALRRVSVCFSEHAEKFEVHPQAIHGGCNSRWSVQEIQFKGLLNTGTKRLLVLIYLSFANPGRGYLRRGQCLGDAMA